MWRAEPWIFPLEEKVDAFLKVLDGEISKI
jgi:hypothetical protein